MRVPVLPDDHVVRIAIFARSGPRVIGMSYVSEPGDLRTFSCHGPDAYEGVSQGARSRPPRSREQRAALLGEGALPGGAGSRLGAREESSQDDPDTSFHARMAREEGFEPVEPRWAARAPVGFRRSSPQRHALRVCGHLHLTGTRFSYGRWRTTGDPKTCTHLSSPGPSTFLPQFKPSALSVR